MRFLTRLTLFGIRLAPILLAIYWILIFTGTHLPTVPMPAVRNLDKVQHFVAFTGLAFLLAWSIPTSGRDPRTKMIFAFLISVCYGMFDELTQQFVGRNTELADFVADCVGALAGVFVYLFAKMILFPTSPDSGERQGMDQHETEGKTETKTDPDVAVSGRRVA
ncbi:VanZ family protein [Roseimaritima ulvae]|uniref:VanZ like family protein n=1 Tax=Roseimaritima ulvae TaxID=980254 RepID=A0A5B9QT49_9BACT|nr:VanZ family protein [Roseimaritima ulvae]QEG41119.1 VanZ like family protein [Roseimaritima ulvae]